MKPKYRETAFNYCSDQPYAHFSSDERKMISRVLKLAEANPGSVEIIKSPEENGGAIYCRIPKTWLRISPPRKMQLTDEQRRERAERMRAVRNM